MNFLLCAKICVISFKINADTLPPQYELFQSLRTYHAATVAAKTAEYEIKEQKPFMKYLPSIGMTYDLQGRPRPSVNFSLNSVYSKLNEQKTIQAKMKSLRLFSEIEYRNDSISLVLALKRVEILRGGLRAMETETAVDDRIFEIQKEKYKLMQITPIEFLNIEREYLARGQRYEKAVQDIELAEIEVLRLAKM